MRLEYIIIILMVIKTSDSFLELLKDDINIIRKLKDAFNAIKIPDHEFIETPADRLAYNLGLGNEDVHLNLTQLIIKYNFPVEEHKVLTEDGYILTLVRIPNSGPVVLLVPGLLSCGDQFLVAGPESGLAYRLASEGYDVWIGNYRGTKYSRAHICLSTDRDSNYWNFSWHEIGIFDLPAMIDHTLKKTGNSELIYVGHSQGTTSFFVLCSVRPEYNKKIKLMVSLSTVAYMSHLVSPIPRALALFVHQEDILSKLIGQHEFIPSDIFVRTAISFVCGVPAVADIVCSTSTFSFCGFDYPQVNFTNLPVLFNHVPCGSSTKQIIHYLQLIHSSGFRQYDYGIVENNNKYGTVTPPSYDVSKIIAPLAIFYADNDWLSSFTDVKIFIGQAPNIVELYNVPYKTFSHLDYLWAKDLNVLINDKVLEFIKKYS